jgi:tRNA A37 threonylcarbamoyladenosine synthetase subunit TsaC/SUA5/YrdC
VANTYLQKKLLKKEWPLFLTSANISSEGEIYSVKEIKENFWEYINKWIIRFLWEEFWDLKKTSPSEIFEFDWNSIKQIFIRK